MDADKVGEDTMFRDAETTSAPSQPVGTGMTRDDIVALFDRRQAALENLDAGALIADYAPDCVVESPTGGTHEGRDAAQVVIQAFFDAFLDLKVRRESLLIDGPRAVQIESMEGTHVGPFLGMPPTGKHFRFMIALFCELRNGKIVHERRIYDFTGLLVQIGVLKAKPA